MGPQNSQPALSADLRDFPIRRYLNQGLTQDEIIKIKEAFDSYQPTNGQIQVSKLL
jgi:hypothetical protein